MILLIDNYDSFSYNLFQMIGAMAPDMKVIRNDACSVEEIRDMAPAGIVLSPGPGRPADAGICEDVVRELAGTVPILGVCLGHQAICESYGATVSYASKLMHGKQSVTDIDTDSPIFKGLKPEISVARYHSLSAVKDTLPESLAVIATADDGEIMAVEDREKKVFGLQFHPESILTPEGEKILKNFVDICGESFGSRNAG